MCVCLFEWLWNLRRCVCVPVGYKSINMWHILITVSINLCFNPGFYVATIPYFAAIAVPEMTIGHSLHPISDFVTCWLLASNSFWNAIIYMLTMRSFRVALSKIMNDMRTKLAPCRRKEDASMDTDNGAVGRALRKTLSKMTMRTKFSSTVHNVESASTPH